MEFEIIEEENKKNNFGFNEIKGNVFAKTKSNIVYCYTYKIVKDTGEDKILIYGDSFMKPCAELIFYKNINEKKQKTEAKNKDVLISLLTELSNRYLGE